MARMTQTEIVTNLADKSGLKKSEVKSLFDAVAELAVKEVKRNGEFTLPGFGKLKKTQRKAREGRNPRTKETITIPASKNVRFKAGKDLRDQLNAAPKRKKSAAR